MFIIIVLLENYSGFKARFNQMQYATSAKIFELLKCRLNMVFLGGRIRQYFVEIEECVIPHFSFCS